MAGGERIVGIELGRRREGRRPRGMGGAALRAHRWRLDRCLVCRMRRIEEWAVDERGRGVLTVRWCMPGGRPVGIQVLDRIATAQVPPGSPQVAELLRELRWIPEPPCPGTPEGWIAWGVTLLQLGPGVDRSGDGMRSALGFGGGPEVIEPTLDAVTPESTRPGAEV